LPAFQYLQQAFDDEAVGRHVMAETGHQRHCHETWRCARRAITPARPATRDQ
jgi:hypothetical protein